MRLKLKYRLGHQYKSVGGKSSGNGKQGGGRVPVADKNIPPRQKPTPYDPTDPRWGKVVLAGRHWHKQEVA